jgi:hypothetical protein
MSGTCSAHPMTAPKFETTLLSLGPDRHGRRPHACDGALYRHRRRDGEGWTLGDAAGKKLLDRHYESSEESSLGSAGARSTQLWTVCWRSSTGRFRRPYNANVGGSTLSANRTYGTGSLSAVPIATLWPSSPATTTSPFRIETCGRHDQGTDFGISLETRHFLSDDGDRDRAVLAIT